MFSQVHEPGEAAQSDFTYMNSLGVTLGFFLTCLCIVVWIFRTGYRLKN